MTMELIVTIIGAVAAIIAAIYAVRNDKGHIRKSIRKKQKKISDLHNQECRKYGLNRHQNIITPEQLRIKKLNKEIADLEDRL